MTPDRTQPRRWGKVVSKTLLVIVGVAFVSPFAWMLFSALKPSNQVLSTGADLFGDEVRWDNFAEAFTSIPFVQILINTFGYAIVGTLITVVVSVLNAYAFARLEFPGRSALFSVFIATLVLPIEVLCSWGLTPSSSWTPTRRSSCRSPSGPSAPLCCGSSCSRCPATTRKPPVLTGQAR